MLRGTEAVDLTLRLYRTNDEMEAGLDENESYD